MQGAYAKLIEGPTAQELANSRTEDEVNDEEDIAF